MGRFIGRADAFKGLGLGGFVTPHKVPFLQEMFTPASDATTANNLCITATGTKSDGKFAQCVFGRPGHSVAVRCTLSCT